MKSNIPSNWRTVKLGDIAIEVEQKAPNLESEFTYIDITSIDRETKAISTPQKLLGSEAPSRAKKQVKTGDVLVSLTRPKLNNIAIVTPDLDGQIASTGFEILRVPLLDYRWIYYITQSQMFIDSMLKQVQGALYPAITPGDVRDFHIPIAPLKEQNIICNKLDFFHKQIHKCRERLDKASEFTNLFRNSLLESAASGTLTADWRKKHSNSHQWRKKPLSEITTKIGSGLTPSGGESSYKASGTPLIRSMNIELFNFKYEGLAYLDDEQANTLRSAEVLTGDVLLNITGTTIGRATVAPADLNNSRVNQHVCIIRTDTSLSPQFLCYFIASPQMQHIIKSENHGTTRQALTKQQVSSFEIPIPSLEEQTEIVRRLDVLLGHAISLENKNASIFSFLDNLMPSLLDRAFSGKLTNQDLSDDSANKLVKDLIINKSKDKIEKSKSQKNKPIKQVKNKSVIEVLTAANDWIDSDKLFRLCGIKSSSDASQIENLYSELKALDKEGLILVKPVKDSQGRKQQDLIKINNK